MSGCGTRSLEAGVEFVERVWLADAVRPGAEVFARRGLSAAFQLVDLRVRPAEPLRKLRAGEPAARRGYAQLTQAQSEGLAGLLEVRTLRPFALLGGAELSRERVVGHGAVDCGVADLAVPQYFAGSVMTSTSWRTSSSSKRSTATTRLSKTQKSSSGRWSSAASFRHEFRASSPVAALHRACDRRKRWPSVGGLSTTRTRPTYRPAVVWRRIFSHHSLSRSHGASPVSRNAEYPGSSRSEA